MKPRPTSSATSRFRRMRLWLIFIYAASFGKLAISSPVVKDEIQHIHQDQNLLTENKDSNETKYSKESIKSSDILQRNSRALPRFEDFEVGGNEEDNVFQHVQKLPSEMNAAYVIPHLRPGRSLVGISNFLEDYKLDDEDTFDQSDKRNRETIIPMLRFGRSGSSIPIPRFGKSLKFGDEAITSDKGLDFSNDNGRANEDVKLNKKNNDAMIPMPRFGRSDSLIPVPRFGRSDSLIPVPRFGRSDSLIPVPRFGRSDSLILVPRFGRSDSLIPIPRFGRSDSLIPVPRLGRSDSLIPIPRFGKRSDSLIPVPRFGRSSSLIPIPRFGRSVENVKEEDGLILNADIVANRLYENRQDLQGNTFGEEVTAFTEEENADNIVEQAEDFETYASELKRNIDDNGTIIPYPRLGRVIETKSVKNEKELDSIGMEMKRQTNESLIPQIRYGRSSGNVKTSENEQPNIFILPNIRPGRSSKTVDEIKNEKLNSIQYGLLPYPRPGRSNIDNLGNQYDKHVNEFVSDTIDILKRFDVDVSDQDDMNIEKIRASFETLILDPNYPKHYESNKDLEKQVIKSEKDGSLFVIPYPRPGKRNARSSKFVVDANNEMSFPHLFKVKFDAKRNSDFVLPYPRLGKKSNDEVSKLNTENIEKPNESYNDNLSSFRTSIQKRNIQEEKEMFISPYTRLSRSNSFLPYPRLGRSNSILSYPRLGRQNSLLPYSRSRRSDSILPYPRLGRSNVILPYPRPGRSLNIVPYPRPGRSTSILPYPRPGRSDLIIPFPRPGRSDVMLPYPRLGRSDLILPYPRPGRSDLILPYPRPGRSDTIVPIPRPGRSEAEENSMLPLAFQTQFLQGKGAMKRDFEEDLIPFTQIEDSSINENNAFLGIGRNGDDDKTGIKPSSIPNNPSLSKKLNKNIPTDESVYLLPYPRPGRFI